EVLAMDLVDDVGPHQRQQFVVALQVLAVAGEALAAEIGLAQLVALDHRAHGAVKDEDAFAEQAGEVATTGVRRWRIGQAGIRHGESRKCGEKAKNARKPTLDGNKMDRHPPADDTVPPRTGASGAARARKVNGKQEG